MPEDDTIILYQINRREYSWQRTTQIQTTQAEMQTEIRRQTVMLIHLTLTDRTKTKTPAEIL